jgi:hypothetical protein
MTLHGNLIASKSTTKGHTTLMVSLCGWNTLTTRERLNGIDGVHVTTKNGQAYLNGYKWNGDAVNPATFKGNVSDTDTEKRNAMKKAIATYSKLYTYPYDVPTKGDCWLCSMIVTKNGKTWGDMRHDDHDHLRHHINEPYVHGSLMRNALKEYGVDEQRMAVWFSMAGVQDTVQRAIRKYLQRRLIP